MRAAAILPRPASLSAPRWVDRAPPGNLPSPQLLDACGGNVVLAAILQARGVADGAAAALLDGDMGRLGDPVLLPDMEQAVALVLAAARRRERCCVFGDYDCDGLSGTALLAEGLSALGLDVHAMLPNRRRDGYGLSPHHVETIAAGGIRLLITVDCGTASRAALERAADLAVTAIVTDHHPPHGALPPCAALLNPRRQDSCYPDRDLCGVGVAHAFLRALAGAGSDLDPDAGLDLVALGTVADVVPLVGENRILVRRGLPLLARTSRPGLRALMEVSDVSRLALSPRDIGFGLAPRLNAAGRLGDADPALALLRARRPREARPLAATLDALNATRQDLTRAATEEAVLRIDRAGGPAPLIVTWDAAWHPGVVGLVAARLVERYGRPAVAVGQMDGRWRGSARSVAGFDIAAALARCASVLRAYGGHPMAAGLEAADEGCLEVVRRRLEALAAAALGPDGRPPIGLIDLHLDAAAIDWSLAAAVEALQPCGAGWPEPVVAVHGAHVLDVGTDGGAARLVIAGRGGSAIAAPARREVLPGEVGTGGVLDLVATPVIRDRRGYRCLELEVLAAWPAGAPLASCPPAAHLTV